MQKVAFSMQLKEGMATEYERRHDEIWPELREALRDAGIHDYGIYLDPGPGTLFAVQQRTENHTIDQLADLPVMRRWWAYMADLMEVNPDNSPVVRPLKPVFQAVFH